MKILCVFGQWQYGDVSRGVGIEYESFIPALQRLGHQVVHFESWDRGAYSNFGELNSSLLETVKQYRPEVMFVVQMHYEIWIETLKKIQERGDVATICWTTDDSWKYKEFSRFVGHYYHAMVTTYPDVLPYYKKDGIQHVLVSQWAANSQWLQEPVPATKCRYNVTFVGAAHGNRKRIIEALQKRGINVACFGHGWPAGSIPVTQIPEIMRNSQISLNFANSKGQNQIKARTFEVPGAGGFLLTEYTPGLEKYYDLDNDIAVFYNFDELVDKIQYYLSNVAERDRIARSGYMRTIEEHTYDKRMMQVLFFANKAHIEKRAGLDMLCSKEKEVNEKPIKAGLGIKLLRVALMLPFMLVFGPRRGPRAARRAYFEFSWRVRGEATYSQNSWIGNLFYKES